MVVDESTDFRVNVGQIASDSIDYRLPNTQASPIMICCLCLLLLCESAGERQNHSLTPKLATLATRPRVLSEKRGMTGRDGYGLPKNHPGLYHSNEQQPRLPECERIWWSRVYVYPM